MRNIWRKNRKGKFFKLENLPVFRVLFNANHFRQCSHRFMKTSCMSLWSTWKFTVTHKTMLYLSPHSLSSSLCYSVLPLLYTHFECFFLNQCSANISAVFHFLPYSLVFVLKSIYFSYCLINPVSQTTINSQKLAKLKPHMEFALYSMCWLWCCASW